MIALHIDTAGGSNFEGYHLRNVGSLHVGGSALAATTLQVTGTLGVSGAVTLSSTVAITGVLTMTGDIVAAVIRRATSDATDDGVLTLTGGGAAGNTRGGTIYLYGNEHADDGSITIEAGNIAGGNINFHSSNALRMRMFASGCLSLGAGTLFDSGSSGEILLSTNATYIKQMRADLGAQIKLIGLNASDQVVLAGDGSDIMWGRPEIALGGGAAPTLGTIGGSGPSVAAQNGWERRVNSAGQVRFVPTWA